VQKQLELTKPVRPERKRVALESKDERVLLIPVAFFDATKTAVQPNFRSSFDSSASRLRSGRTEIWLHCRFFLIFLLLLSPASADTTLPIPRFVTIKSGKVNVRVGPGTHFPLKWVYTKSSLPVEIIAEFDTWRKVRDMDGSEGWVHQNMLVGKRNVLIKKNCLMNGKPCDQSRPVAKVNENAILQLVRSDDGWCLLKSGKIKGWIKKEHCWGIYKGEVIK